MTIFASLGLLAALTSPEAIAVLLNTANASSPERFAEAQRIVLKDAEAGKPLQMYVTGVTTKDPDLARRYLDSARPKIERLARERDNPLAWYLLSMERNDLEMLEHAAELGNIQALNSYGYILIQQAHGKGVGTNAQERAMTRGFNYFKRAAVQKDPSAFVNLGTCYLFGFGCAPDHEMAHRCFRAAAEAGNPEGMNNLSASYEKGHGVEPNAERALFWRMKARAVSGDKAAREWLKK